MDSRQVDVAFVLEDVPGVRAVYAIRPGTAASAHFDFAVELAGTGAAAHASYALLRVLTYDDIARVYFFHSKPAGLIASAAELLRVDSHSRELARVRVKPPVRGPENVRPTPLVLVVETDEATILAVRATGIACDVVGTISDATKANRQKSYSAILASSDIAFGIEGLLANLRIEDRERVLVLTDEQHLVDARWRLRGTARIIEKPVESWIVKSRIESILAPFDLANVLANPSARRRLTTPDPGEPFQALLVDTSGDIEPALRRIVRHESRINVVRDSVKATDMALTMPFHLIACSSSAMLPPRGFLDGIGREDPMGAHRVVVLAPDSDIAYTRWRIERAGRTNLVLPSPVDELLLAKYIRGMHPSLAERLAIADFEPTDPLAPPRGKAFRRSSLLVVDDQPSTAILFAARDAQSEDFDIVLAQSQVEAFEVVVSRPVDALIVSASMRAADNEPFYRVLWRLHPDLKSRTILVTDAELSGPVSNSSRIVNRPLDRAAITRLSDLLLRRA